MKQHFKRSVALIARIGAGNGDAKRINRGVSASPVGIASDVDADAVARPVRLVDIREMLRQGDALRAYQGRDCEYPAAISFVVRWPQVRAVDGSGGFQDS